MGTLAACFGKRSLEENSLETFEFLQALENKAKHGCRRI